MHAWKKARLTPAEREVPDPVEPAMEGPEDVAEAPVLEEDLAEADRSRLFTSRTVLLMFLTGLPLELLNLSFPLVS